MLKHKKLFILLLLPYINGVTIDTDIELCVASYSTEFLH